MTYRAGLPGWKLAARLGLPISFVARAYYDFDSKSYWAESTDLHGLCVSGETLDELHREVMAAAQTLLELALGGRPARAVALMRMSSPLRLAA